MSRPISRPLIGATVIFLVTLFFYWQMIPWIMYTWKITGDEPHYLLAAHSLVHDGDLDLKNNYLNGDHRDFYPLGFLDPHVKEQANGQWLMAHDVGLAFAVAPAYAWGGRLGVMRFMAGLGALLAAQMFLLGWEVSGKWWAGGLGWLSLAFSAPLSLYVFQIYPELIGGLLVLFALRHILQTPAWLNPQADSRPPQGVYEKSLSLGHWILVIGALVALPWFSGRYAPLMLFLWALLIWKHWPNRKLWIGAGLPILLSLAFYLSLNFILFGGPTPSVTTSGNAVGAGFSEVAGPQIGRGLAAWWFDQQRGLLVYGPVLIVAFLGIPYLWKLRRVEGVLLWAPVSIMWVLASVWGGFYIGWEISARFLIVGLPLLAGAIAAIASRVRNIFFWPLAAGLLTLSVLNTVIVVLAPFYAYHESPIKFYEEATHWQIRSYLPALGTRTLAAPPNGAPEWRAAAGEQKYLLQTTINELSIGWYVIRAQAQFDSIQTEQPALMFDVFSSESGIPLTHADIRPAAVANHPVAVEVPFYNPYYDQWNFPLYVDVRTTGAEAVRLSWLLFEPDPVQVYSRVGVWLALILLLIVWFANEKIMRVPQRMAGARANPDKIIGVVGDAPD